MAPKAVQPPKGKKPADKKSSKTSENFEELLNEMELLPAPEVPALPQWRKRDPVTVSWQSLLNFVFPENLEHPESTGRLELFASDGPPDEDGKLRGGIRGRHVHADFEVKKMIIHNNREALLRALGRPQQTAEVLVDTLLPLCLKHNITKAEVEKLLRKVPRTPEGRLEYEPMQDAILENQQKRLLAVVAGMAAKNEGPRVPFQSAQAHTLGYTTRKKKVNAAEEQLAREKRLATYGTLVAALESQNKGSQLVANTRMCRGLGIMGDCWDRYCAVRRAGKSSYVMARNEPRCNQAMDDGIADRHPGVSSLVSAQGV